MSLTVLSVAYALAPVGPHAVGGAEEILGDLDRELVASGNKSFVAACEGSEVAGELIPLSAIGDVLASRNVDLVHMHGIDFHEHMPETDVPVLVTLHMPISWYPEEIWHKYGPNVQFQCVSENQRQSCPRDVTVITNGVEIPPFEKVAKSDFALVLGRICPEKNYHEALEAGTLADTRVLIGGQVFPYPEHEAYFHEKIEPLLGKHEFLGPLLPDRKQELLAQAKCLLHPTVAPETSALVAMEAMAAGTPVIAYRSGALPDIVEDGLTGFLVDGVPQMADAIGRIHMVEPDICRRVAEQRFSKRQMLDEYFRLYRAIRSHSKHDRTRSVCA